MPRYMETGDLLPDDYFKSLISEVWGSDDKGIFKWNVIFARNEKLDTFDKRQRNSKAWQDAVHFIENHYSEKNRKKISIK